jgi:hypothetical protein
MTYVRPLTPRECLSDTLDRISDSYKIASGGNSGAGNNRAFHVEFTCNHTSDTIICNYKPNRPWMDICIHIIEKWKGVFQHKFTNLSF